MKSAVLEIARPSCAPILPEAHAFIRESRSSCRRYFVAKRIVDVVATSLLALLVMPLIPLIVIAIKLDSPGPVIFRQRRIRGRRVDDGSWVPEPFTLYKFRTMDVDADSALHREYITAYIEGDNARLAALRPGRRDGDSYRPLDDPRVTRVGAVLRRLSLDELPQMWNVVRGDMSLVGPRPSLPYEVAKYRDGDLRRLTTPQGITGLAQVEGRCALGFEDLMRLDLAYLAGRSVWLDLKVMLRTVPVVLSRKGAD
jgi:lipopolysaccharide/colanic/teichoic acid biosynthesis glycosyltransferase